ncbi:hypothetical protein T484DRAFT_1879560 [Baffinella frigidus]|nr:hypothetical protein T484DRAFT_1879560 [Cryptophyta sp. CCMP2293]
MPVERDLEGTPAVKRPEQVRVCDGFGCHLSPLPQAEAAKPESEGDYVHQALDGDGAMNTLFPGGLSAVWEPEVHMSKTGEIRADHGDPNGVLYPRNKYQNAAYPDGSHERDAQGTSSPGLTDDIVGRHLFRDNIVSAAPGFNAGLGRHVRAQQYSDWMRNWETHRPTKADASVTIGNA